MGTLDRLVDRMFGPWCQAVDHEGEAVCFKRVPLSQPGLICDDCWLLLAEKGEHVQRITLAEEPALPPPAADVLVKDNSAMVRAALAENGTALLEEHRRELLRRGEEPRVLRKMARRSDLTVEEERMIVASDDVPALRLLAANNGTSSETITALSAHPDQSIRQAMHNR